MWKWYYGTVRNNQYFSGQQSFEFVQSNKSLPAIMYTINLKLYRNSIYMYNSNYFPIGIYCILMSKLHFD